MGGVKNMWGDGEVIFITIFLHFHYFISLETANIQESEILANILNFTTPVLERNFCKLAVSVFI